MFERLVALRLAEGEQLEAAAVAAVIEGNLFGLEIDPRCTQIAVRPFLSAQLRKGGKTGAGILRAKPGTIKWAKDRGKEPMRSKEECPWFWGWDESNRALRKDFGAPISDAPSSGESFDGNRWNDLHYTRAAKEAARARHRGEG
jgi:hypothetical protein